MRLNQKIFLNQASSVLSVNSSTFAELTSIGPKFYKFSFTFRLSLTNDLKRVTDYDRVLITIKEKDVINVNSRMSSALGKSTVLDTDLDRENNNNRTGFMSQVGDLRPSKATLPVIKLPPKVQKKLYAGIQISKDIDKKENYLAQKSVFIAPYVEEISKNQYSITEIVSKKFRADRITLSIKRQSTNLNLNLGSLLGSFGDSDIDPKTVLERMNIDLVDPTSVTNNPRTSKLNSLTNFTDSRVRKFVSKDLKDVYFDFSKYFLETVSPSPQEGSMTWYEKRETTKSLDYIEMTELIDLPRSNRDSSLDVRFDLYKKGSNVVDETFVASLPISRHTEAYVSIQNPPNVTVSPRVALLQGPKSEGRLRSYSVSIKDTESPGKITKFNAYIKEISDVGDVLPYRLIKTIDNKRGSNTFTFVSPGDLSILRIVPVDVMNLESNVFTNTVVGSGYKSMGKLSIVPICAPESNKIQISVLNVPRGATALSLMVRNCGDDVRSRFVAVQKITQLRDNINNFTMSHDTADLNKTYEYYVIAFVLKPNSKEQNQIYSEIVTFRNTPRASTEQSIQVSLTNPESSVTVNGDAYNKFTISTNITPAENKQITEILKTQYSELYDLYLNPQNNSASPLLASENGVPIYSDLYVHEVTRIDTNTGTRETFSVVPDGEFMDDTSTQALSNVSTLNPQHNYHYQVFTYRKNPIELFKEFVAYGITRGADRKPREWFYLPYKWKNSQAELGKLYPDSSSGIPIIDAYDNLTSKSYGMTASYRILGSTRYTEIYDVRPMRIDRNTVRIDWDHTKTTRDLYDSFVVMKVVNGVRSFVGRTFKNYIYHELNESDLGTVYYIVSPVMAEFDIDSPGYSPAILVTPDGISKKTKASSFGDKQVSFPYRPSTSRNEDDDVETPTVTTTRPNLIR